MRVAASDISRESMYACKHNMYATKMLFKIEYAELLVVSPKFKNLMGCYTSLNEVLTYPYALPK